MNGERKAPQFDIYLVGRYFSDLIFTDLPEMPRLGHEVYARTMRIVPGGVATPAIALTRLGLRVAWPCVFGSDVFSQQIKELVLNEEVDTTFFSDSQNPILRISVAFSFEEERAFLSYIDNVPELDHAAFLQQSKPRWLYITNLHTKSQLQNIAKAAREVGSKILMDCQAHQQQISNPQVFESLQLVDVFTLNQEEARILTGSDDLHQALEALSQFTQTVIIKRGSEGCICQQDGRITTMPAMPARVVDTTGAGDNFNCGFLFGQLNAYPLEKSLLAAIICGSLSVQGYGGASTSPRLEELLQSLSN